MKNVSSPMGKGKEVSRMSPHHVGKGEEVSRMSPN